MKMPDYCNSSALEDKLNSTLTLTPASLALSYLTKLVSAASQLTAVTQLAQARADVVEVNTHFLTSISTNQASGYFLHCLDSLNGSGNRYT